MTQDEIIRMAREAGALGLKSPPNMEKLWWTVEFENLERFAALVAEATKEKAAKVCEEYSDAAELEATRNQSPFADGESSGALGCAAAIRSMK